MSITVVGDSNVAGAANTPMMVAVVAVSVMSGMLSVSNPFNNRIETGMRSRNVLDNSQSAISFLHRVTSFHVVTIAMLELRFLVAGVRVVHSILEFVMRRSLNKRKLVNRFDFCVIQ